MPRTDALMEPINIYGVDNLSDVKGGSTNSDMMLVAGPPDYQGKTKDTMGSSPMMCKWGLIL